MGIPLIVVTDEMVPQIQEMLESGGIKVKKKIYFGNEEYVEHTDANGDVAKLYRPTFHLHCEDQEGYKVILTFSRILMESCPLTIVIRPQPHSSFLKSLIKPDKNKLVDPVIEILKAHGAQEYDVLEETEDSSENST